MLIKLCFNYGYSGDESIWINSDHIKSMQVIDGVTVVTMQSQMDYSYKVKETPEQIIALSEGKRPNVY